MVETSIQISDGQTRWGLVRAFAENGAFVRDTIISGAEADEIRLGTRVVPSGVSREEWESGLAAAISYSLTPGMASVDAEGGLTVMYGVERTAGRVSTKVVRVPASEWQVAQSGKVTLPSRLAQVLDVGVMPVSPD